MRSLVVLIGLVLLPLVVGADRRVAVPPIYPPQMIPAEGKPLPVYTFEPVDVVVAEGEEPRIVALAQGKGFKDIENFETTVADPAYVSWSQWPLGTEAWHDTETLGEGGRRASSRRVDRLERWAKDEVFVKEYWAGRSGLIRDGSGRGIGAESTADWAIIPRRAGELRYWRIYRARFTISEASGPTSRPGLDDKLAPRSVLVNADGYVRPQEVLCTVVEWCEDLGFPPEASNRPAPGRFHLTREVRHPSVPDGVLMTEWGTARLDEERGLVDDQIEHRSVLDRVIVPPAIEATDENETALPQRDPRLREEAGRKPLSTS